MRLTDHLVTDKPLTRPKLALDKLCTLVFVLKRNKKTMIRKIRNQKEIHTPNTDVGETKLTIRYEYIENIYTCRKPSEQLFPNRRSLSYPNLTKTMKTYIRFKQHKIRLQN